QRRDAPAFGSLFWMPDRGPFLPMTECHAAGVDPKALRRLRRSGFTMIELMVVVVIIAVVTTAAFYSYATFRNSKGVDVSGGLVEQVLLQSRNRLLTLNRIQEIRVDLDRNTI